MVLASPRTISLRLERDAMRGPHQCAMKYLALLGYRHAVPAYNAFFQVEHANDRPHEARLAAAVGTLEDEQLAGIQRKSDTPEQATIAAEQRQVLG